MKENTALFLSSSTTSIASIHASQSRRLPLRTLFPLQKALFGVKDRVPLLLPNHFPSSFFQPQLLNICYWLTARPFIFLSLPTCQSHLIIYRWYWHLSYCHFTICLSKSWKISTPTSVIHSTHLIPFHIFLHSVGATYSWGCTVDITFTNTSFEIWSILSLPIMSILPFSYSSIPPTLQLIEFLIFYSISFSLSLTHIMSSFLFLLSLRSRDHQYNYSIIKTFKSYIPLFFFHNCLEKSQPNLNLTIYFLYVSMRAKHWRER